MKTSDYLKTFEGMKFKENLHTYVILILSGVTALLLIAVLNKDVVVTMYPSTLSETAEVGEDWGSRSYLEAWGLWMSLSLGNVTPESMNFIKPRITPVLSPKVYQTAIKTLEAQVAEIRDSHVTLYFEPRHISVEGEKIFVHGQSVMETTTGHRERDERTYEFIVTVLNYLPSFEHIATYEGPPRNKEFLAQQEAKKNR